MLKNFFSGLIDRKNHRPCVGFEYFISAVIVLNALTAGLMLSYPLPELRFFDSLCVAVFCLELVIRFIASRSVKAYFTDPLQIFDILVVVCCLIPENFVSSANVLVGLRVVRLLRITRFISMNREMSTVIKVLLKSVMSLYRVTILMLVFVYVFSIIGVGLFRMPDPVSVSAEESAVYERFKEESQNYFVGKNVDPFGSVSESMFTLFKVITGDDWSNLRNNLVMASELGIIRAPSWVITFYFTAWFIFGAYLLLNLLVGAILQNYEELYSKVRARNSSEQREREINEKVSDLVAELVRAVEDEKLSSEEKRALVQKAMNIIHRD